MRVIATALALIIAPHIKYSLRLPLPAMGDRFTQKQQASYIGANLGAAQLHMTFLVPLVHLTLLHLVDFLLMKFKQAIAL